MFSVFLLAQTPPSTSELADRADVSERSVRRHREPLVALAIVTEIDEGWRLKLAVSDADGTTHYPEPIVDDLTSLEDLVYLSADHYLLFSPIRSQILLKPYRYCRYTGQL